MIGTVLSVGSILGKVAKTIFSRQGRDWLGSVFGNQAERERYQYEMTRGAQDQLAAEFRHLADRTWADVLADVLNRFPRPLFAYQYLFLPFWLIFWPESFAKAMVLLSTMPTELWFIYGGVVGFYFGFRYLDKKGTPKFDVEQFQQAQEAVKQIEGRAVADEDFEAEMADTGRPMSNQAIMEWNQRRQKELAE